MTDRVTKQTNEFDEAQAIERAKQGDADAFQALYDRHKRRVYSLCLRMTANTAEAEDLAQEAFLQLYRKIATFRGESAFSTWLHRLSVNVVLMHLRKKSLPLVSLEETTQGGEDDSPPKDLGQKIWRWLGPSTGCSCRRQWTIYPLATARFLCCTMCRVTNITKLQPLLDVPLATASRSCTKRA